MRALVTGGDGFVGQHLIRELLGSGHEVAASVLRLPAAATVLARPQCEAVTWAQADVRDAESLHGIIASLRPAAIFHLAGFSSGAHARAEPHAALMLNAGGTLNLLSATARAREEEPGYSPRILVMGSGDAYGFSSEEPIREDRSLSPRSPYGLSKACQELVARTFRRWQGLDTVVVRSFNLLGPGQSSRFAVPDFSRQVAAIAEGDAAPVLEVGNLRVERDFLDVRDAVRALRSLAELERPHETYNVCSGRALAIRQLVDWILDEAGVEVELRVAEARVRPGESERVVGDPGLLMGATGWAPRRDLEASVKETYRWVRDTAERPAQAENVEGGSWT